MFSLFPALLIAAGLLGTLDTLVGTRLEIRVEAAVLGAMHDVLTSNAKPLVDSVVDSVSALFHEQSVGLLTSGALGAVWSVSSSVSSMLQALSVVMVLLVAGPLFGTGDVLAAKLGLDRAFATAWTWARAPLAVLALTVWIASLFHFGPSRRERWRVELPGAFVSALSTVLTSLGLRLHQDEGASPRSTSRWLPAWPLLLPSSS